MNQKRQIEVLNEATNKALSQIRKKRKDDNKIDFKKMIIKHMKCIVMKKLSYLINQLMKKLL
jgi:hypothetical protein